MMPNAANPAQENARILIACESLYTWLSLGLRAVLGQPAQHPHPLDAWRADAPISLFLGSRTDTSQLVSIPKALLQDLPQGAATSQLGTSAGGSSTTLLGDDSVQRLAAFDCAAPIHDAVAFQDPPGGLRHASFILRMQQVQRCNCLAVGSPSIGSLVYIPLLSFG